LASSITACLKVTTSLFLPNQALTSFPLSPQNHRSHEQLIFIFSVANEKAGFFFLSFFI
jgi:hypothetical protein